MTGQAPQTQQRLGTFITLINSLPTFTFNNSIWLGGCLVPWQHDCHEFYFPAALNELNDMTELYLWWKSLGIGSLNTISSFLYVNLLAGCWYQLLLHRACVGLFNGCWTVISLKSFPGIFFQHYFHCHHHHQMRPFFRFSQCIRDLCATDLETSCSKLFYIFHLTKEGKN